MKKSMLPTILAVLMGLVQPAGANFLKASPTSITQGTSGCFAAEGGGALSLLVNPGALSRLKQKEAGLLYTRPIVLPGVNIQEQYAAVGVPLGRRWTLGLGGSYMNGDNLLEEEEVVLGASVEISRRLALGVGVGGLRRVVNIGQDTALSAAPLFDSGNARNAYGLDAGLLYRLSRSVDLGFSARHINRPDMGFFVKDPVPAEYMAGVSLHTRKVNVMLDVLRRDAGSAAGGARALQWGVGTVWSPLSRLAFKAAVNPTAVSAGVRFTLGSIGVDYSYGLAAKLGSGDAGAHRIGMSYRFGKSRRPLK